MASDTAYELLVAPDGTSWAARENLHDVLRRELLGPADGNTEVLDAAPDTRYLVGRGSPRSGSPPPARSPRPTTTGSTGTIATPPPLISATIWPRPRHGGARR